MECPKDYDPQLWAKLSRKEQMRILGIDRKTYDKMQREASMRRLNQLAANFQFYAYDKESTGARHL